MNAHKIPASLATLCTLAVLGSLLIADASLAERDLLSLQLPLAALLRGNLKDYTAAKAATSRASEISRAV